MNTQSDPCNPDEEIRRVMSLLGSKTSVRKTLACRANAKKPRKKHTKRKKAVDQ